MVHVRLFAGAADAAGTDYLELEAATVGQLRQALLAQCGPRLAEVLPRCSLLVDGVAAGDDRQIESGAQADVLPPFAGG